MTVERIVTPNKWVGTSTDTKPTFATEPRVRLGDTFYEYDTLASYITYDGTNWLRDNSEGIGFLREAAGGKYTNVATINKYGRNIEIDSGVTADIWDGGKTVASGGTSLIWLAPTAAAVHNIKSSSSSDDGDPGGVGARTVRIYGLTDWDTVEITEDITLNGTSNVATSNSFVIIYRMKVLTKGATNVNVGLITATATSPSATTITARIEIGKGQTQMAIFAIPSTRTLKMDRFYANMNKAGGVTGQIDVALLVNPEPDAELLNFLTRHTFGLQKSGTTAFLIPYTTPKVIEGPAIIKAQVSSDTNDMDVSAGFDGVIVPK